MAAEASSQAALIKESCPECGKEMVFPETATEIVCPGCNARFSLVDEPSAREQAEALGGAPPAEPPPPPPEPPAPPPPPRNTPASTPVAVEPPSGGPVQPASTAPAEAITPKGPAAAPVSTSPPVEEPEPDDEEGPPGAGDTTDATDHRKRGGGRKPIALAPKGPGVTDFIWRTREYQWVAKEGLGNPYGPTSVSTVIFEIVAAAGAAGIDPVDLAVELRRRLVESKKDCSSILQRIVMVCERICCNAHVSLMERVPGTERIRVVEKHRLEIPIPPADMVGAKRRRELEAARAAVTAAASEPPPPPPPG